MTLSVSPVEGIESEVRSRWRPEAWETENALMEAFMLVVYVAGPYTAPTREGIMANIASAVDKAVDVAKLGCMPVCPHSNTSDERFEKAQPYKFWIDGTMELLRRSDALITVEGWANSPGACGEVCEARTLGLPVFHTIQALADYLLQDPE